MKGLQRVPGSPLTPSGGTSGTGSAAAGRSRRPRARDAQEGQVPGRGKGVENIAILAQQRAFYGFLVLRSTILGRVTVLLLQYQFQSKAVRERKARTNHSNTTHTAVDQTRESVKDKRLQAQQHIDGHPITMRLDPRFCAHPLMRPGARLSARGPTSARSSRRSIGLASGLGTHGERCAPRMPTCHELVRRLP